jgi:hypothetical protein
VGGTLESRGRTNLGPSRGLPCRDPTGPQEKPLPVTVGVSDVRVLSGLVATDFILPGRWLSPQRGVLQEVQFFYKHAAS